MKKLFLTVVLLSSLFLTHVKADYSQEFKSAYTWAFNNGITTQPTIDRANMNGDISRIELSKMISNYAMNNLKKKKVSYGDCSYSDISVELDQKYDNGVTNACQLGLMGQGINEFRPYDKVTKAEFGTILSRLLYGGAYDGGYPYYIKHLKKLNFAGIVGDIDNADVKNESRGNVMVMLRRSVEGGNAKIALDAYRSEGYNIVYGWNSNDKQYIRGENNIYVNEKLGFIIRLSDDLNGGYVTYKSGDNCDGVYFYEGIPDEGFNYVFTIYASRNPDGDIKCEGSNNKYCFVIGFTKGFDEYSYLRDFIPFDI